MKPVKGLDDKKIIQIACGSNHSYALDDEGNVYAWGFAGYGRRNAKGAPGKEE